MSTSVSEVDAHALSDILLTFPELAVVSTEGPGAGKEASLVLPTLSRPLMLDKGTQCQVISLRTSYEPARRQEQYVVAAAEYDDDGKYAGRSLRGSVALTFLCRSCFCWR